MHFGFSFVSLFNESNWLCHSKTNKWNSDLTILGILVADINELQHSFNFCSFSFQPRNCNRVAHSLTNCCKTDLDVDGGHSGGTGQGEDRRSLFFCLSLLYQQSQRQFENVKKCLYFFVFCPS